MLEEINAFFRTQKGRIQSFKNFQRSGLYEFYGNIFGPLVFTEEKTRHFIALDDKGYIYDEVYYPQDIQGRVGTIIPKLFLDYEASSMTPSKLWQNVSQQGYAVVDDIEIDYNLTRQVLDEAFIPHGINPELNMSKSIFHAYFATLADYENPEDHKVPEYMNEITRSCLSQIPHGNFHVNQPSFHTADVVKYIYDPSDSLSTHGPYSFHMDYFSRLHYMFFIYFSKSEPVEGRELLVGKRDDFADFSQEALDLSPAEQQVEKSPFESVPDSQVQQFDTIKIGHCKLVLMNTLNPMMVHRVEKLKHSNEVILITNYCWCSKWPSVD